jgi:2-desacetyl-2-hydroxyethyl bacteriochlorophyllide A dehydrogenase
MDSSRAGRPTIPSADHETALAVWFPGARQVELRQEDVPAPTAGEVRVRTIVSGLSQGTEMLVYRGQVPPDLGLDLSTLRGSFQFPIKYGYATVGRVVEVGAAVRNVREGDLVFVHHPHQTEFVVPASMAIRLPPDLPPESGVLFANVETAINVVLDAHPHLGERLLIFGQGVVGLLLTQLARMAGAAIVMTVDPVERRRDLSAALGAHALPPGDELAERVHDITAGQGADIVIEASGNPAALVTALDCVAPEGTIVVCSWYGTKPVALPLGGRFHRGRIRLISSQVGSIDPALSARWSRERRAELARDVLPRLCLTDFITHRIPFELAAEAYALVDIHPDEAVQVTLTYRGQDV